MFSEALYILDRNTEELMSREWKKEVEDLKKKLLNSYAKLLNISRKPLNISHRLRNNHISLTHKTCFVSKRSGNRIMKGQTGKTKTGKRLKNMKVIGIIAEYNPFHNGHAYQIAEVKKRTSADFVIIAMSGNFVQRGAPAIIEKAARTKMALKNGADLVIELPALWATASAEYFSMAGVTLFEKMGCVDSICFGAETDNLRLLSFIAEILANEPKDYQIFLSSFLKEGMAFPKARANAIIMFLANLKEEFPFPERNIAAEFFMNDMPPHDFGKDSHSLHPPTFFHTDTNFLTDISKEQLEEILNSPNNILALEYLKALKRRNSRIKPYLIKREGAGYHESDISDDSMTGKKLLSSENDFDSSYIPTASATGIRQLLLQNRNFSVFHAENDIFSKLIHTMPVSSQEILKEYLSDFPVLDADDFSDILGYLLLYKDIDALNQIGDIMPDIANRFYKNRYEFSSFSQFCAKNKSRDVTYTRISRILMHFILGITKQDYQIGIDADYIPYLRILGFQEDAAPLLSKLKQTAKAPVISRMADAKKILQSTAPKLPESNQVFCKSPANNLRILEIDLFAGEIYRQVRSSKQKRILSESPQDGPDKKNTASSSISCCEYSRKIIII